MKHIWTKTAIVIAFTFLGYGAMQAAQDDDWYQSRESFYHSENWRMHFFDRVRDDLNHVQAAAFPGRDEYRLEQTQADLTDLQTRMTEHRYDERELDSVIGSLTRVVADNRLLPRDRDMLKDDPERIRDYRAHHEEWR